MTSAREGWGLTLTESLERGVVPVVMDSSEVFKEIITNGENGILVKNKDIDAYTDAILYLINNDEVLKKMSVKALESEHRFTLNKALDLWEQVLIK
jgi:glycosyltransferase involved in cell wall biosynthesis